MSGQGRAVPHGIGMQVQQKIAGKRDPTLESDIMMWMGDVLGQKLPDGAIEDVLKDGVLLCHLMNKLSPGSISRINTSGPPFKLMENVNRFQDACKAYGVPEVDLFQTVDLFEKRNIPQVVQGILAVGRAAYSHPEFQGPFLGPKPSEECKRDFTQEQLRAGEGVINLQYGTNKGANQSGQNFGNTRHM